MCRTLLALTLLAGLLAMDRRPLAAQIAPADPLYGQQGYLIAIGAAQAWQIERGRPEIAVAVISTGIDTSHPDLRANLWSNTLLPEPGCGLGVHGCTYAAVEAQPPRDCPTGPRAPLPNPDVHDELGLGTYLAGIVAAATDNGAGIAGVAPNVRLMAVKVSHCSVAAPGAQAAGINYAVRQGARVLLLDGTSELPAGGCLVYPPSVAEAVRLATLAGAVVVAPAGDGGSACAQRLAGLPGAIVVAAAETTPFSTTRAHFNQVRADVALAAPGVNIVGPAPAGACRYCDDTGYRAGSSTAAAAALTAGSAALVLSRNPALGPAEVREVLTRTAGGGVRDQDWAGAGLIHAGRAVASVHGSYVVRLLRGGRDAPDGMFVSALVGEARCAEAMTRAVNGVTSVTLHVPSAALRAGCGSPEAAVTLRAGGLTAALPPWQPGVQQVTVDLPAATPAPSPPLASPGPVQEPLPPPGALVGLSSTSGARLSRVLLTSTVSDDLTQPGPAQQLFTAPGQQVVLWTEWSGTQAARTIFFRWGRPDGTIYREGETRSECPCVAVSRWQLDWAGPNGGDRMLDSPGVWQIDIYMDGEFIGGVQFRVARAP